MINMIRLYLKLHKLVNFKCLFVQVYKLFNVVCLLALCTEVEIVWPGDIGQLPGRHWLPTLHQGGWLPSYAPHPCDSPGHLPSCPPHPPLPPLHLPATSLLTNPQETHGEVSAGLTGQSPAHVPVKQCWPQWTGPWDGPSEGWWGRGSKRSGNRQQWWSRQQQQWYVCLHVGLIDIQGQLMLTLCCCRLLIFPGLESPALSIQSLITDSKLAILWLYI